MSLLSLNSDCLFKILCAAHGSDYILGRATVRSLGCSCAVLRRFVAENFSRVITYLTVEWVLPDMTIYRFCGLVHRENDLPAIVRKSGTQEWYRYGKLHRDDDKPALVEFDGTQTWYKHGKVHRDDDLPAFIDKRGVKKWCRDGVLHREGGPAAMYPNGCQYFYTHGVYVGLAATK